MADFIQNVYVPSGTGRPRVLTNVQLPEVEPDFGRRASNFVPYSSLYQTVYPRRSISERRSHKVYKWSLVGALVLLVVVVMMAVVLLGCQNSSIPSGSPPSNHTTVKSPTSSTISSTLPSNHTQYNTSSKDDTKYVTVGKLSKDGEELSNLTMSDSVGSKDLICSGG